MTIDEAVRRIEEHNHIHQNKEPRAVYITEAFDMVVETVRKYQKIQEIYDTWNNDLGIQTHRAMRKIGEVLNGSNNSDEEVPMSDKDKLLLEVNKAISQQSQGIEQDPCEDCISRREAIKKFTYNYKGERIPDYDCDNFPVQIDVKTVKKILTELPPVTPAKKKEPCEDCISRKAVLDIAKSSKSNWIDNSVLFKRVNELSPVTPQSKTGHWIPVSERLPNECDYRPCHEVEDGAVFWLNKEGLVGMGYYYESTKTWSDIEDNPIEVIKWMPLPDTYES